MSELILELFSEEIPAFMQKGAEVAYTQIFTKALATNAISFESVKVFSGPRRIAVYVTGLPKFIEAKTLEIKGPKVGAPAQAVEGFCKSNEISASELAQKEINGQLFYIYLKSAPQTDLKVLLSKILPIAIKEHTWPKSMFWGDYDIAWVRPLKNIMCLFDGETLPLKFGHLTANNITYGHRFMAPEGIIVNSFQSYKDKLQKAFVIIDREERARIIGEQLGKIASEYKLVIKEDIRLLEEVTGLVEWPVVMIGKIPEKFLKVPPEALISSMRTHQKYFSSYNSAGNFAPYFLFVSNLESSDPSVIIHGNEKVLSARLSDALYFYEQDLKKGLEAMGDKLENLVFHEKLGTIYDKVERIKKICKYLVPDNEDLQRAVGLCKNDLTSEMVGEFPELQGIMGYYYALDQGINEEFAKGIRDHYKPLGPSDNVPKDAGAIFAVADKIDSLVGLMLADEVPTGSSDPYALRRISLGLIRIIIDRGWSISLKELINYCIDVFKTHDLSGYYQYQILQFIEERAKFYLKNQYDISLINAALDLEKEDDFVAIEFKLDALKQFSAEIKGQESLTNYRRANNILKGKQPDGEINIDMLKLKEEQELFSMLNRVSINIKEDIQKKNFPQALESLASMNLSIKNFFDNVMVNVEDPKLSNNRLLLLQEVRQLFEKIAKFDQL